MLLKAMSLSFLNVSNTTLLRSHAGISRGCYRSADPVHRHSPIQCCRTQPSISAENYMRLALDHAQQAYSKGEVPIGAVLVDATGSVIASGHNEVETKKDCTRHAEMVCLQHAMVKREAWRLPNTVMYCTLEPCPMCLSALSLARVSRIVFGAPDIRLGACGSWIDLTAEKHPFHNFENIQGGVLEREAAHLMRCFFRKRRKDPPRYKP